MFTPEMLKSFDKEVLETMLDVNGLADRDFSSWDEMVDALNGAMWPDRPARPARPAPPTPTEQADDSKLISSLKGLKDQAFFNSPWPDGLDRLVGMLPEAARGPIQEFMRRISPKEFLAMVVSYLVFRQFLWDEEVTKEGKPVKETPKKKGRPWF